MQKVYLKGRIGETFASEYEVNCSSIADIIKLLSCQVSGFREYLIDAAERGINYQIIKGKEVLEYGEELLLSLEEEDIVITEIPEGSKGWGRVIAGVILVIVGAILFWNPAGWAALSAGGKLVAVGGSLMMSAGSTLISMGVSDLMMQGPSRGPLEESEGYLFDGPINTLKEGQPVPVLYGELLVGGAPVAVGFSNSPIRV